VLLGEAEASAYSECVQESRLPVPLGFKAVPLAKVLALADGAVSGGRGPVPASAAVDFGRGERLGVEAQLAEQACDREAEALGAPAAEAGGRAGITWLRIPGGSFRLGSAAGGADEQPVRTVRVDSFELMKTEVTVRQYEACVQEGACTEPAGRRVSAACNWGRPEWGDHPVNCVGWDQARAFAAWAEARLPTEAEWEYAARGGRRAATYPWGDAPATCARATMEDGEAGCGAGGTRPVCSVPAGSSQDGVCDLAGNVWEWVQDHHHASYGGGPTDGRAWEDGNGTRRVFRGGSWGLTAEYLRASKRDRREPGRQFDSLGFRPAR
jgi:formylglycine-generating enzyme required for sulfatase activity